MDNKKVVMVGAPPDYNLDFHKNLPGGNGIKAPLGLLMLATVLRENNFPVRIIDGHITDCRREIRHEIENGGILCIGFSVMSSQYRISASLSRMIRAEAPGIPVVWGGIHSSMFPEQVLENNLCDYVIRGEGDRAFLELCRTIRDGGNLENVPNLFYSRDRRVMSNKPAELSSFDQLPALDWKLLGDVENYVVIRSDTGLPTRRMNVLAGLGCNFRCAFCHNAIFRKKHRRRKAEDIVGEMNLLHEQYRVTEFWIDDEDFFGDRWRLEDFLELLEKNRYRFKWNANLRASYIREDYINRALLRRIAASGCSLLAIGAESGSPVILRKLMKDISLEDVMRAAHWTRDVNITVMWLFMVGIPGETCKMTLETLRLARLLKKIKAQSILAGPQVYRPFPGSPLYEEALELGLKEPSDWEHADDFLESLSHLRRIEVKGIPWHPDPEKFKYMMLSFYTLAINKNSLPRKAVFAVPSLLAKLRLKTGFYSAMLERTFLDYMNSRFT